jgi:hypothetical protein
LEGHDPVAYYHCPLSGRNHGKRAILRADANRDGLAIDFLFPTVLHARLICHTQLVVEADCEKRSSGSWRTNPCNLLAVPLALDSRGVSGGSARKHHAVEISGVDDSSRSDSEGSDSHLVAENDLHRSGGRGRVPIVDGTRQ